MFLPPKGAGIIVGKYCGHHHSLHTSKVYKRRPRWAQKWSSLSVHLLFLHCLLSCNKIKVQFYSKRCFLFGNRSGGGEERAKWKRSLVGHLLANCWSMGWWRWNRRKGPHMQMIIKYRQEKVEFRIKSTLTQMKIQKVKVLESLFSAECWHRKQAGSFFGQLTKIQFDQNTQLRLLFYFEI